MVKAVCPKWLVIGKGSIPPAVEMPVPQPLNQGRLSDIEKFSEGSFKMKGTQSLSVRRRCKREAGVASRTLKLLMILGAPLVVKRKLKTRIAGGLRKSLQLLGYVPFGKPGRLFVGVELLRPVNTCLMLTMRSSPLNNQRATIKAWAALSTQVQRSSASLREN